MAISKIPNIPKLQDVTSQGYSGFFLKWDSNIIEFSSSPTHRYSNGYCANLIFAFTVKQDLASYSTLFTLKDSTLIPKVSINFYQAALINDVTRIVGFQVLQDGTIRAGISLSANSVIKVQLQYPTNVTGGVNTCLLRWSTSGAQHDQQNQETKFSKYFSSRSEYFDRRILYALLWRECDKQTDSCCRNADVSRLRSRGKTWSNIYRLCRKCVYQGKKLECLDELEKDVIAYTSSTFDGRCAA